MALYRVTEYGRFSNPVVETRAVWWMDGGTGLSLSEMGQIAEDYADAATEHRAPYMHESYQLYQLGFQQVRPVLLPEQVLQSGFPVIGEGNGELMPTMLACVVNFVSNTQKPNRARKYFAGWQEAQNVNGAPGVGVLGACGAFGGWIVGYDLLNPLDVKFGCAELLGEFDYTFHEFNGWSVKPQWGVQRRRRPGTGI